MAPLTVTEEAAALVGAVVSVSAEAVGGPAPGQRLPEQPVMAPEYHMEPPPAPSPGYAPPPPGAYPAPYGYGAAPSPSQEADMLRGQAEYLEDALEGVKKRIEELEAQKDQK